MKLQILFVNKSNHNLYFHTKKEKWVMQENGTNQTTYKDDIYKKILLKKKSKHIRCCSKAKIPHQNDFL